MTRLGASTSNRPEQESASTSDRRYITWVAVITVAGLALRLILLDRQPLWRDEAFTAIVAQRPTGEVIDAVSRDSAPPLHYLVEHLVAQGSAAPWALRLVSTIAGTAMIPLVAALASRAAGRVAGFWAAGLVAALPTTVIASRDARMYALAAALACASLLCLLRAVERPSPSRVLIYAVVSILAVWTQYFTALAIAAQLAAALAICRPPGRRALVLATLTAVAGLSILPWLTIARQQFAHTATPFWVEPVGFKTLSGTAVQFLSGPPIDPGVPFKIPLQVLQGLAVAAGGLALLALGFRRKRLTHDGRRGSAVLVASGCLGLLLLAAISLWHPLLEARYASVLWPPLFAAAGVGMSVLPRRLCVLVVGATAIPTMALSLAVTHPQTADVLPRDLAAHDILVAAPSEFLIAEYYATPELRKHLHVIGTDVPWFWGTAAYPQGAVITGLPPDVVANSGRIFVLTEPEDSLPALPPGYRVSGQTCAIRVCLTTEAPTT